MKMFSCFLYGAEGITGLSLKSFKENWDSDYQTTNNAGIPDPDGKQYWNFKYGKLP
jgi:solute carrier family 12 (potassium/chloride transporter), member 4/6